MLSDKKLLKKLRKVMGATITFPSLFACSSQISRAEVYYCSINNVNYKYDNTTKCLTISGKGEVTDSSTYLKKLKETGAEFLSFRHYYGSNHIGFFCGIHGIKHVIIDDGVTGISKRAFEDLASLEDIVIPNSVTKIGESAFTNCILLKEIIIPEFVKELEQFTFSGCIELKEIKLPNNLESIGSYVFSGCKSLESIKIPPFVKKLGGNAFSECKKLKEITMPSDIEGITPGLFYNCENLETVKIPSSIKYIHYSAFKNCESLSNVEFYSPLNDLKSEAKLKYPNDPKGETRYWVENCPEKYRDFAHALLVMEKKTDFYMLEANKALYGFFISRPVIYPFAFHGCKKLKKISFPTDVRFNVGTDNMRTVSVEEIISAPDEFFTAARYSKLEDFFESGMKVKINGEIYCVK